MMSVLASLLITGCSQEEVTPPGGEGDGGSGTSYMAVNLMSSDVTGSRAAAGYEDGSETENKVEMVRFYFFTDNGLIANVKLLNGSYVNFYDWTPETGNQQDDKDTDDTESILKATIVINTKQGDKLPQGIVAVLNPPKNDDGTIALGSSSKKLSDLKDIARDYVDYKADGDAGLTSKGKFVMFNSVYGGTNKTEVCAVPIEARHLQKKAEDAKKNPVYIYVERSVAKVSVKLGDDVKAAYTTSASDKGLALKDKEGKNLQVGGKQVYLKLSGWDLTAETNEGRLVKAIDPVNWTSDWWNGTGAYAHRSFWAINSKNAENKYYDYFSITNSFTIGETAGTSLYTNENALDFDRTAPIKRTKVIVKGTLCKENGDPFTIVRHMGAHFADTYSEIPSANLPELKKNILSQLSTHFTYYFGDVNTRTGIGTDDLKIVVAEQKEEEGSKNNCYVYAQLTEDAAKKTWYTSSDEAVTTTVTADEINEKLKDKSVVDWALVWKSGMTYYYYEIVHNGTGINATKGVVRNHIYKTTVTAIAGLGTPVYDPGKVIYPEKPDDNDHYIAAEINILSWRIVENGYKLEW